MHFFSFKRAPNATNISHVCGHQMAVIAVVGIGLTKKLIYPERMQLVSSFQIALYSYKIFLQYECGFCTCKNYHSLEISIKESNSLFSKRIKKIFNLFSSVKCVFLMQNMLLECNDECCFNAWPVNIFFSSFVHRNRFRIISAWKLDVLLCGITPISVWL